MDQAARNRVMVVSYYLMYLLLVDENQLVNKVRVLMRENHDHDITGRQIRKLVDRFWNRGALIDLRAVNSGRKKRTYVQSFIDEVQTSAENNPTASLQQRAADLAHSVNDVYKVLKSLGYHAYKPIEVQVLSISSIAKRIHFCRFMRTSGIDFSKIWFSDEKIFPLKRHKNHQNDRFWSLAQPENLNENLAHPAHVHAWCALSSEGIIGPYFFSGRVDQNSYQEMIDSYFIRELEANYSIDGYYFQQDGATPHCTVNSIALLSAYFNDRLISRNSALEWPPSSPDLNPLDFFLWGALEKRVMDDKPTTADQLKESIRNHVAVIHDDKDTLISVIENFRRRLDACVEAEGRHFAHIM